MPEPSNHTTDIAVVEERLKSIAATIGEIKSAVERATTSSNNTAAQVRNATTKLEGDINLLRQTVEQTLDAKAEKIRGDLWRELYQSTWKQVAIIATILALVTVAANAFTVWLVSGSNGA